MVALTNYGENQCALLFGDETTSVTSTRYVALHSGDPGETGATDELSGDGYARVLATFSATGSTTDNDADIVFAAPTLDKGTVTHVSVWDAITGGNCWAKGALTTSFAWPGGTYTISAGDLDVTFD